MISRREFHQPVALAAASGASRIGSPQSESALVNDVHSQLNSPRVHRGPEERFQSDCCRQYKTMCGDRL
jgi:hypothetical protein